jgi:phosphotransferase system IIB component
MNPIASIARSGLDAAQTRLRVAANNIANVASEGFERQGVVATAQAGGGVTTSVVAAGAGAGEPLVDDLLAARQASYEFAANLKMVKTSFGLIGSLFDEQA